METNNKNMQGEIFLNSKQSIQFIWLFYMCEVWLVESISVAGFFCLVDFVGFMIVFSFYL